MDAMKGELSLMLSQHSTMHVRCSILQAKKPRIELIIQLKSALRNVLVRGKILEPGKLLI